MWGNTVMRANGALVAAMGTLIVATSVIQLANGFFTTLISLRVALEGFAKPGQFVSPAGARRDDGHDARRHP